MLTNGQQQRGHGVLFVDDEEMARKYFTRAFSDSFRVLTAGSVEQATRVLEEHAEEIAVLVTDQRMPGRSGVDLLRHARERHPAIVRVLTTAYADLDDAVEAVNRCEVFRYVTKPWDVLALRQDLFSAVDAFDARRRTQALSDGAHGAMGLIAADLAQALRSQLQGVQAGIAGVRGFLPYVLERYFTAGREGRGLPAVDAMLRTAADDVLDAVGQLVQQVHTVADMALLNVAPAAAVPDSPGVHSAVWLIERAVDRYPYAPGEADRLHVERYGDFQVRGNERLLVNVLLNLLRNSLQAIGETGKGEVYVFVAPGEAADYIIVTDTGPGIPEDVLPQVFNEFFTTRPVGSGTGMGLAFCRRVMDGVGGRIDCHSRLGEFTEMVLSFPRLRRQSTRPPQDPREPRPTEAPE